MSEKREIATLAAGCFWCVEAVFKELKGVVAVVSGYTGGSTAKPTYEQVCTGTTGHAEAVQITFDPEIISFREILDVFWHTHDPTTLNRQGADAGTQYRSAIFFHNEEQRGIAEESKQDAGRSPYWANPIVTEILPFTVFHEAEAYHQNFFQNNPNQNYCRLVITPKLRKYHSEYKERLKNPDAYP